MKAKNIGFVVSDFNKDITSVMLDEALLRAERLGHENAGVVHVFGVYDSPLAVKRLLKKKSVDAVVVLGAVIKGETKHDEVVVLASASKLAQLSLEFNKPVGLGIIGHGATRAHANARKKDYAGRAVDAVTMLL